jgi:hypothetical protein
MKTLLGCAGVVGAFFAVGCGCDPGNNSQRAPIDFEPSSVHALRTPATCGNNPSFSSSDTFALDLTGETDVAPPYTTLSLDVPASVVVNQAIPLVVSQDSMGDTATASSNDGSVTFTFGVGSNALELDSAPLDSVVVTIVSLPAADGQSFSAELRLTFEDGRVLDQVYSAPLQSVIVTCS